MSNNDLDFVQSTIDGLLPAGIVITCEPDANGGVRVTGSKAGKTLTVLITAAQCAIFDSDKFVASVRPKIKELYDALNGAHVSGKPKRKAAKPGRKKRKAKRAKPVAAPPQLPGDIDTDTESSG